MEKKNMVLLTVIAIATLLVAVVGATFAYFTATIQDQRTGGDEKEGQAAITAAESAGNLIIKQSQDGFGGFNDQNVLPGHKELIQISIQSDAKNKADTYFNIVYEGTNTFPQNTIEFKIYESKTDLTAAMSAQTAFECKQVSEAESAEEGVTTSKIYEDCQLDSKLKLDPGKVHVVQTTQPKNYGESDPGNGGTSQKTVLNGDLPFVITGDASDKTMYYYIVVEYKNAGSDQTNADKGKSLNGKISVEMAAKNPDAIKDTDSDKLTEPGE